MEVQITCKNTILGALENVLHGIFEPFEEVLRRLW